jgi:hypothetical protein
VGISMDPCWVDVEESAPPPPQAARSITTHTTKMTKGKAGRRELRGIQGSHSDSRGGQVAGQWHNR